VPPARVLWLIKGLGPGGAERLLVSAAPYVDRDRFEVEAAYLLPWKDHLVGELEAAGVPTTCLEVRRSYDVRWGSRLRELVASRGISLVHAHLPYAAIGARLALRGDDRPAMVSTEHNTWDRYRPAIRWLNSRTIPRDDAVIAVSQSVADSMGSRRSAAVPVHVIANGVDAAALRSDALDRAAAREDLGVDQDRFVIGTVGGLTAKKGHRVLVRAARQVVERIPDALFVFVGLPVDPDPIRDEIDRQGMREHVVLSGYRANGAALMPAFDLYCLPSLFEGMPVSLLEAFALGLPTVATSVGGVPEVATDGEDALVVPPDDPGALAAALAKLATDPDLRRRLGERAAATAERFSMAETVRRTEAVYDEALAKRREKRGE
jgi:glycosyltransferase involved in cell wall biosynthesis